MVNRTLTAALAGLLKPSTVEDLLRAQRAREPLRVARSHLDALPMLFSWEQLNQLLETHQLSTPRLRLMRRGSVIQSATYSKQYVLPEGERAIRLLPSAIEGEMRSGATLVLRGVDELNEGVRVVAEALELTFQCRVHANVYACWRDEPALDTHYDDHDVLVVQTYGRKQWELFGLAAHYVAAEKADAQGPPAEPHETFLLTAGDVLYLPRGWWHRVTSLNEPTVHVTIGIYHTTGADLLLWAARKASRLPEFLKNVPRQSEPHELEEHMRRLGTMFAELWTPAILDEVNEQVMAQRPRFRFPVR